MGENKALKHFLGRPLIQRVIERLTPIADEILVTTNQPADFTFLNLPLFSDIKPGRGPLGGLYTALVSAKNPVVAVIACDMPFVNAKLIEAAARFMVEEEADVVIAQTPEGYEPLHAIYRRATCIPAIEAAINNDQWRMVAWFPQVKVRMLSSSELDLYDPEHVAFLNVNTAEEFAEAEKRAQLLDRSI
jgi:molybdopterin-guanine dinucleotide biosynthesis protein A